MFEVRAVSHSCPRMAHPANLVVGHVDGVGEPDIGARPPQIFHVLHRTAIEPAEAKVCLVRSLGEMGVHADLKLPGQLGGRGHQIGCHAERRARGKDDPRHRPGRRVVEKVDDPAGVLQDDVVCLDDGVRGQASLRLTEAHRPPRDVEADTNRAGAFDLVVDTGSVGPQIVMIEGRRATAQGELGQPDAGRDTDMVWSHPRPNGIEGEEPVEKTGVLGARDHSGQGLIEVMMGVDQAGEDDMAGQIDHLVGRARQLRRWRDLLDPTVACEQTPVPDLVAIHGHEHFGMTNEEGSHRQQR